MRKFSATVTEQGNNEAVPVITPQEPPYENLPQILRPMSLCLQGLLDTTTDIPLDFINQFNQIKETLWNLQSHIGKSGHGAGYQTEKYTLLEFTLSRFQQQLIKLPERIDPQKQGYLIAVIKDLRDCTTNYITGLTQQLDKHNELKKPVAVKTHRSNGHLPSSLSFHPSAAIKLTGLQAAVPDRFDDEAETELNDNEEGGFDRSATFSPGTAAAFTVLQSSPLPANLTEAKQHLEQLSIVTEEQSEEEDEEEVVESGASTESSTQTSTAGSSSSSDQLNVSAATIDTVASAIPAIIIPPINEDFSAADRQEKYAKCHASLENIAKQLEGGDLNQLLAVRHLLLSLFRAHDGINRMEEKEIPTATKIKFQTELDPFVTYLVQIPAYITKNLPKKFPDSLMVAIVKAYYAYFDHIIEQYDLNKSRDCRLSGENSIESLLYTTPSKKQTDDSKAKNPKKDSQDIKATPAAASSMADTAETTSPIETASVSASAESPTTEVLAITATSATTTISAEAKTATPTDTEETGIPAETVTVRRPRPPIEAKVEKNTALSLADIYKRLQQIKQKLNAIQEGTHPKLQQWDQLIANYKHIKDDRKGLDNKSINLQYLQRRSDFFNKFIAKLEQEKATWVSGYHKVLLAEVIQLKEAAECYDIYDPVDSTENDAYIEEKQAQILQLIAEIDQPDDLPIVQRDDAEVTTQPSADPISPEPTTQTKVVVQPTSSSTLKQMSKAIKRIQKELMGLKNGAHPVLKQFDEHMQFHQKIDDLKKSRTDAPPIAAVVDAKIQAQQARILQQKSQYHGARQAELRQEIESLYGACRTYKAKMPSGEDLNKILIKLDRLCKKYFPGINRDDLSTPSQEAKKAQEVSPSNFDAEEQPEDFLVRSPASIGTEGWQILHSPLPAEDLNEHHSEDDKDDTEIDALDDDALKQSPAYAILRQTAEDVATIQKLLQAEMRKVVALQQHEEAKVDFPTIMQELKAKYETLVSSLPKTPLSELQRRLQKYKNDFNQPFGLLILLGILNTAFREQLTAVPNNNIAKDPLLQALASDLTDHYTLFFNHTIKGDRTLLENCCSLVTEAFTITRYYFPRKPPAEQKSAIDKLHGDTMILMSPGFTSAGSLRASTVAETLRSYTRRPIFDQAAAEHKKPVMIAVQVYDLKSLVETCQTIARQYRHCGLLLPADIMIATKIYASFSAIRLPIFVTDAAKKHYSDDHVFSFYRKAILEMAAAVHCLDDKVKNLTPVKQSLVKKLSYFLTRVTPQDKQDLVRSVLNLFVEQVKTDKNVQPQLLRFVGNVLDNRLEVAQLKQQQQQLTQSKPAPKPSSFFDLFSFN